MAIRSNQPTTATADCNCNFHMRVWFRACTTYSQPTRSIAPILCEIRSVQLLAERQRLARIISMKRTAVLWMCRHWWPALRHQNMKWLVGYVVYNHPSWSGQKICGRAMHAVSTSRNHLLALFLFSKMIVVIFSYTCILFVVVIFSWP